MDIQQVKAFCLSLSGAAEKESGPPSNILSYAIYDKKFAYFKTSEPERWRFSIRATPERFLELSDQPGIKPARYMQRFHWVSIVDVRSVDDKYLKVLIRWSYQKALTGLPRKLQRELIEVEQ